MKTDPRDTPPMPFFTRCIPRGLVRYQEKKDAERKQAASDRHASYQDGAPERSRQALIAKLQTAFRYIDVTGIANQIEPWDTDLFKQRVAEAQHRFFVGQ